MIVLTQNSHVFRLEASSVNVSRVLSVRDVKATSTSVFRARAANPEHRAVYNSLITTGKPGTQSQIDFGKFDFICPLNYSAIPQCCEQFSR